MTASTDTEIRELIIQLNQNLESKLDKLDQKLESKLDKIVTRLEAVEVGQARAEERLNGVEKGLDGINQEITRLRDVTEKQDNRYYTLLISTIGFLISAFIAVLIGLGKVLFFPSPSIS